MFSIITTNKNKTATAPTYTITKIKAKNSNLNKSNITDALQKIKIKNRTEWTGFSDVRTNKELIARLKFNRR
jgi:hypothetical protein